ncbi:MAG: glutamate-1-semialdehyde-2,1-aminomutase [Planctomycetes bacterium]|nr:glutamate-1-semialdehyde-2,1-aminomutase [Planctomycetota bacterium]
MGLDLERSAQLLERGCRRLPGGVNSPVRAYRGVGGTPPFIIRGDGCRVVDEDGNHFVDLVLSYGPLILGHGHPDVVAAVKDALERGTAFGAPTEAEIRLAEAISERVPSVEMVRLVNSGTEATMSALRLARAATERDGFVKFNGCYHGHGDAFLVKAGSGALTFGAPDSPGVPESVVRDTLVAEFNDLDSVRRHFDARGSEIAAIFVEPVAGNMGCVLPQPGFLEGLRELCDDHGALLVFDEVMTGFRVARGGYQEICGVRPDLTTLGKVIGGGLPVGAYGGRKDLMEQVSPAGEVYQAGTLSGNPLAVAAGLAALEALDRPGAYDALEDAGAQLQSGLEHILDETSTPGCVNRQGSMLCLYFSERPVSSFQDVLDSDRARFTPFFHHLLEHGVLLPPSPFEAWFLSRAHDTEALDEVLDGARSALTG